MKKLLRSTVALVLALLMLFEVGETGIAYAVDEVDRAVNPTKHIELTVPEKYQSGENLFFIATADWATSEKNGETLYIPIQRAGDLDGEAEVTLKVVDLSAKHDVNYTIEMYKEDVEPETFFVDKSIKEMALSADYQEETELGTEDDLGQAIYENGGAEMVDGKGRRVGTVTANRLDENGNPIFEKTGTTGDGAGSVYSVDPDAAPVAPGQVAEGEWTEPKKKLSPTQRLRAARNSYTGTTSDRQELSGGSLTDLTASGGGGTMAEDEYNKAMADAVADNYPGKEYRLTFAPGEEAKFLVIKPLYSSLAEGDAQLFMLLKEPSEDYAVGKDVNPVSVTIYDVDEPEPVTIRMAAETVYAENGKASVTVTREGRLNAIKGVMVKSWGGSAKEGDEYSGVGAKLWFPTGITSRTVEIPVYHGAAEKDFYITITPLNDELVAAATTHVVIPVSEKKDGDGVLLGVDEVNGHPLTDPINLQAGWFDNGGFDSETAFHLSTRIDEEETSHFWLNTSVYGSAYDGMYVHYNGFLDWCNGEFRLSRWNGASGVNMNYRYEDSGGIHNDLWLYGAWDSVKAPEKISVECADVELEGFIWTPSSAVMWVDEVRLIKRQFTVKVEAPELKPLIGVDDDEVLTNYQAVLLDNSTNSTRTLWSGDSFALNAKDVKSPLRLVGVEAKIRQGDKDAWYRLSTIDGKSSTVTVEMNPNLINTLDRLNCISWSENKKCDFGGKFYKGEITVRPVFDYIDAAVELKSADPDYGALTAQEPLPNMLWDFNADMSMDEHMGITGLFQTSNVSWTAENDGGHDSYRFTAGGGDPYVTVADHAESVDRVRYLKFAARNLDGAAYLQLFASANNAYIGPSNVKIPLYQDTEWHEYVVDLTQQEGYSAESWKGALTWFRLDPMEGNTNSGSAILIDYMAFFSSEGSARAFRSQADGRASGPALLTYHVGDTLTLRTDVNPEGSGANMRADGFFYELRTSGAAGVTHNAVDQHYINGSLSVQITDRNSAGHTVDHPYYSFEPTFTEGGNRIAVLVSDGAVSALNTAAGIFAQGESVSVSHENGYWVYVIDENVLVNDLYEVSAYVKDTEHAVAKWTLSDGSEFYGDTLYFRSNARTRDNAVTLEVYRGGDLVYAQLDGTVVSSTMNLSSGRSATDKNPVQGAILTLGYAGAVTDEKGSFTFPAILFRAGGRARYLVSYNGVSTIQEAKIPGLGTPEDRTALAFKGKVVQAMGVNLGQVRVDTYSTTGAHFISVTANQYGKLRGGLNAVAMDGQELVVIVRVAPGTEYTLNHQTYTEHIKEVRLYFQDQYTGETHGVYSSLYTPAESSPAKWSWNEEAGEFVLQIYPFDPEHKTEWTYGDVLMAQLTTDKRGVGLSGDRDMVYDPVSTGFGVYADPNYKPRTYDYSIDSLAESLQISSATDEDGKPLEKEHGSLQDDDTRYSYGTFPYLGEITASIKVVSKLVSTAYMSYDARMIQLDLEVASSEDMGEDGVDEYEAIDGMTNAIPLAGNSAWEETPVTFGMFFTMTDNFYGGVRFMLGAIFSYGQGNQYERTRNTKANLQGFLSNALYKRQEAQPENVVDSSKEDLYIYNEGKKSSSTKDVASKFGGPYFSISAYFGVYLCYGYIEISKNGGAEKSHEMVFMGAGGFIGFGATVGYTWAFMAGPIPLYVNVEAGIKLLFFLGSEADPNKTLKAAQSSGEIHGQDFSFNFSFDGRIYVTGTFGVGFSKLLGIRVSVTVGFNTGYNMNIPKWFPELFDDGCGYTMDATFAGTIDLLITSIDLYSATWPIPIADGYLYWFQEANRGNKCISYVENGLAKGNGDSDAAKAEARRMADELIEYIDNQSGSVELIKDLTYALKNYAYSHGIISWVAKNTIEMNKQAGIAGAIINGALQDDSDTSGVKFHTQPHVKSQWVADQGRLMSAYSVVKSTPVMEDAFHQPSSRIIGIGGNRFLMTFLDDTASRDAMQAATLKWTVYDANDDSWTEPRVVQADGTVDSRPSLTDAGDKIILAWASATDEKYAALRESFAAELRESLGREPEAVEITEAMEADPARVLSIMDIFTAEFSKSAQTFGAITQLTDDAYYDDYPLTVYDAGTKDYIVLYYKTAQDDEAYDSAGDKLEDLIAVSPDPDRTYSVVCYMLYNSQTDAADTRGQTHEPGWARDYLFPLETSQTLEEQAEFLTTWGGQRFLPSTIRLSDGSYADPPIADLAVASGLNGLAAFAFTVDRDFNMDTAEDRELYMQYYNFQTHGTYVPIRVAGDKTVTSEVYNSDIGDFEKRTSTQQVEVGTPKLIRNGGSTFLFWREDNTSIRYLNVSNLLNAKVPAVANPDPANESDWTYAVRTDGTFATNAVTGETYAPNVQTVDVLSYMTDKDIHITDFEFIADDEDNLYVVWTDAVATEVTNEFGEEKLVPAQEIFVSGMIQQDPSTLTYTDEQGTHTDTSVTARWSKPYRLTRENAFNDGLALAMDDQGGLIIVHNQFTKQVAESEEEMMRLIAAGKIGLTTDRAGNYYASSLEYNSPIRMMVTRCDKVGSLEATEFTFSDKLPVAGQVIGVQAVIENTGLTDAKGYEVTFYECKDGVKGRQIGQTLTSDETIPVNTARVATFLWTVPADGPEGYSILASVREKNGSGYYDATETRSEALTALARFSLSVNSVTQDGDEFLVDYTVKNTGNKATPEDCKANLLLTGLYGDLDSEKYGFIKDNELYSTALALPAKTAKASAVLFSTEEGDKEIALSTVTYPELSESARVKIPASVFRFCGYDGVQLVITDQYGDTVAESGNCVFRLAEPMNLSLNNGSDISLDVNSTQQVALSYDSNVFLDEGTIVYSVEDPTVASVTADGTLMGLSNGTTTLTATLLPYGSEAKVKVTVIDDSSSDDSDSYSYSGSSGGSGSGSASTANGTAQNAAGSQFKDVAANAFYADAVDWAVANGITNGTGDGTTFSPDNTCTRAEAVTFLYRAAGSPEVTVSDAFKDIPADQYYAKAVAWAVANGITNGTGDGTTFSPDEKCSRAQIVTFLFRFAKAAAGTSIFLDVPADGYYAGAVGWAVENGITNGTGDGTFSPDMDCTRGQIVTFLYRNFVK